MSRLVAQFGILTTVVGLAVGLWNKDMSMLIFNGFLLLFFQRAAESSITKFMREL